MEQTQHRLQLELPRAFTKKKIIFCGYHGWQDWYAAATSRDLGTLNDIKKYSINIRFNNFDDLKIISKLKDVAAVIMEPMNREFPLPGFLKQVRKLCNQKKIILILMRQLLVLDTRKKERNLFLKSILI